MNQNDKQSRYGQLSLTARYGLAAGSTALSALVRWLVPGALAPAPYLGFYPAVVVSAALGGVGPGLVSTFASLFLVNFVFGRFNVHDSGSMMRQVIWVVASIGVSLLAGMQRTARMRERQRGEELQETAAALQSANAELAVSRRAAINLLEDALDARRQVESERARWQGVVKGIADEVWLCDHQGKISLINLPDVTAMGLEEFCDWSLAEVLQEVDIFDVDGTPRPAEEAPLLRSLRTGEVVRGEELMLYRRAGKMRHRQFSCAPTHDATTGQVNGAVAIVRDITAQKETEAALRVSEERLRFSLEACRIGAWDIDLVDHTAFRSIEHDRIFGYDHLLPSWTLDDFLKHALPEYHAPVTKMIQEATAARTGWTYECRIRRTDGEIRWIWFSGRIYTDTVGHDRVAGVVQDITERKRAEEALRESEEQFRTLTDSIPNLAWWADADGYITWYNQRWYEYTGTTPEQMKGWGWQSVHDPEVLPSVMERWKESIATGRPFDMVFPLRGADGVFRPFLTRVLPVRDENGDVARWFGTNTDISEQKRAEEALQKAHTTLAEQMEERVRELREKEVLLKEVHHRVKNNLQVISSLVNMQADGIEDETVRQVLQDVTYRVRSMALVHEKLYQSESLARVDFAEYAQSLLNYLWRAHGATAEAVRLACDLEPVELPVDTAVPCGLILNELAGNALKHAFRGRSEGEVTVALRRDVDGRVSLGVRDNGVGMPEEPDWRQANSLGLRLVQMLAGQLGASVEVDRSGGTGFTVSFRLKAEGETHASQERGT